MPPGGTAEACLIDRPVIDSNQEGDYVLTIYYILTCPVCVFDGGK